MIAHFHQRFCGGRIGCGAFGRRERVWSSGGIAESEDPVEEAQFEGSVMANAVASVVGHRIAGNHRLDVGSVADGEGMLRCSFVGRAQGTDATIEPGLRADPLRGVESVVRVIDVRTPVAF